MSHKVRFWVLLAIMVGAFFFSTGTNNLFSHDTMGGWLLQHLTSSFLFAGIANSVLLLVLYAKKRTDITTALLIVFAVVFFPITILAGGVLLLPHLVYCLVKMLKGARARGAAQ